MLEARRKSSFSVGELRQLLGYDSDEIRRALEALENDGLLRCVSPDAYELCAGGDGDRRRRRASARDSILMTLENAGKPIGMREIADLTGHKIGTLRAQMSRLVSEGLVTPTAPATNASRKYTLTK